MKKSRVFIISGEQGEGKTTRLQEVIKLLRPAFPDIFGFYAIGEWENGYRNRFRLVDIRTGNVHLLCYREGQANLSKIPFVFIEDTLRKGMQIISDGMAQNGRLAVIDEIGRFELKGKVWYQSLKKLLGNGFPVIITVRKNQLEAVIEKFGLKGARIFFTGLDSAVAIASEITEQLAGRS